MNGLRHRPTADTCGWYIWAGDTLSSDPDFFEPVHIEHLADIAPDTVAFLALPPGWRFLIAPGHQDVWRDDSLLEA